MSTSSTQLVSLPKGESIEITTRDGASLRCVISGEGRPVILAHGYLHDIGSNNLLRAELNRRGYRVYGFEQRGHGASTIGNEGVSAAVMARDYVDVLEHLQVEDAVLFAHSMGGFLSLVFQMEHPEVATKYLRGSVVATAHAGRVADQNFQNMVLARLIQLRLGPLIFNAPILNMKISETVFAPGASRDFVSANLKLWSRQSITPLTPILFDQIDQDYYPRLSEIKLPTVVVSAQEDQTCPAWHSEKIAAGITDAKLIELEGVGHTVVLEAPEACADIIESLFVA